MSEKIKKVAEGLFVLAGGSRDRGYLVGSQCSACDTVVFPKRPVCPHCLADHSMKEIQLSRTGTLYAYSINQVAPEGFKAPYMTGKIDLPEKVRVFSVITGCEPSEESLEIGMEMEIAFTVVREDSDGSEVIGYAFRPRKPGKDIR